MYFLSVCVSRTGHNCNCLQANFLLLYDILNECIRLTSDRVVAITCVDDTHYLKKKVKDNIVKCGLQRNYLELTFKKGIIIIVFEKIKIFYQIFMFITSFN